MNNKIEALEQKINRIKKNMDVSQEDSCRAKENLANMSLTQVFDIMAQETGVCIYNDLRISLLKGLNNPDCSMIFNVKNLYYSYKHNGKKEVYINRLFEMLVCSFARWDNRELQIQKIKECLPNLIEIKTALEEIKLKIKIKKDEEDFEEYLDSEF